MIKTRRLAREIAIQALYSLDLRQEWSKGAIQDFFDYFFSDASLLSEEGIISKDLRDRQYRDFSKRLVVGVADQREEVDILIAQAATRWSIDRLLCVDRNILRLATYELIFCDDIPMNVSINEAIEIAKRLGTDESPTFVNGVLDQVGKMIRKSPEKIAKLLPETYSKKVENT